VCYKRTMQNERPPRARRARYEDVVMLREQIGKLSERLDSLELPGERKLPMTEEYFKGLCIIGLLANGGFNQLKYAHQRAEEAWRAWQSICPSATSPVEELVTIAEGD